MRDTFPQRQCGGGGFGTEGVARKCFLAGQIGSREKSSSEAFHPEAVAKRYLEVFESAMRK
jgi:hypothetical protein